ncbi:aromatic prenyltransferase [Streptomyces sp. NPDC093510]|uniref:aromatic prenyltransferase n=1 Tax=Streptomyces sp. NPDC093510 TaxID=3155199 RepID=UPI0034325A60
MPDIAVVQEVYSAIEESARQVGVPCSREQLWPVLTAFGDDLADAGIVLSVSSDTHPPADLDYTITVPPGGSDPYALALAGGFIPHSAHHPAAGLLSDLRNRIPVSEHFIDSGVVGGFSKIYAHFPFDTQEASALAELPSMPRSLAHHAALFARHHLNEVAMVGIDYRRKTVNLYFAHLADAFRQASNLRSLHRAIGLPEPDGAMRDFAQKAFRVYVTLSWDSLAIERICYAHTPVRGFDPAALPRPLAPAIHDFIHRARRTYAGRPIVIAAAKWTPQGAYVNLGPYIRLSPLMRKLLQELTQKPA